KTEAVVVGGGHRRRWLEEDDNGSIKFSVYESVILLITQVLKKNDAGEHFSLLAICLGFELVTMIVSKYDVSPETFQKTMELCSFFKVLTTSNVSTAQSKRYPVTMVQWHPEA
nr:gamma-glutamyl hydrolase 2-like [Tanacetum cinerariifolium]